MDFPVCPSCGQSVIDDDAEDCPFCGSSMKVKPGAKPATKSVAGSAAKPAASAKPGATVGKAAAGKPAAAKAGSDDFPFDTDIPGASTAIQAMPNPSKGRTLKIVCPMCETAGYVPPNAVGKDVKCANQKCMVPIFKAPAPVVEAPPPPPPKKSNVMMVGGITATVMIAGGVVAYVVMSQPAGSSRPKGSLSAEDLASLKVDASVKPLVPAVDGNKKGSDSITKSVAKPTNTDTGPKTPEEFIKAALKQMNESCLADERNNRSKPFCRQLTAEACALVGEISQATSHLDQLNKIGNNVPYYQIDPNLELFWNSWRSGEKSAAMAALNTAREHSKRIPTVGRHQLGVAGRLAAALAVAGRIPEALTLLEGHQTADLEGQLAARVQMASDGRVARLTGVRTVLPWRFPQAVAATASLIAREQLPAARAWAGAQPDEVAKAECLSAWAENVAFIQKAPGSADSNLDIVNEVKQLEPALAARVWARAACGRILAGDIEGAEATLKLASNSLALMSVPAEPTMPDVKLTAKTELPDAAPLEHAATAAAEIAFVCTLLADKTPDADTALELALTYARGLAPGLPAVTARANEAKQAGNKGLRDQLKKLLALKNDDLAAQAVLSYNQALNHFKEAAKTRFDLQTRILSRLAESGLKAKVWAVVSDRSAESNPSRRDDFLDTALPGELIELFKGTETEKIIQGALRNGAQIAPPERATTKTLVQEGSTREAAEYVSSLDSNSGLRDDVALTVATLVASEGRVDVAFAFVGGLKDAVLREEAYVLVAGLGSQRGQTELVWKQVAAVNQATEKVALCRGLIAGLKRPPAEKDLREASFVQ